jgi:hypothetical protein
MSDETKMLEKCVQQFEFLEKLLKNTKSVRKVGTSGKPEGRAIASWKVAADECAISATQLKQFLASHDAA